jgi:predicted dehydrogenase
MKILVIGGGKMGMSHLALLTQYVGKANVALCDSKRSTRWMFRWLLGYKVYPTVDIALARMGRPSGVLIATPTPSHATLANWAIEHQLPFFIEKPLTLDVKRSTDLVKKAADANVPAQVGFVLRYVASFQRLREMVSSGALGPVKTYTASMRGNFMMEPPEPGNWQGIFSRGGGCLNEYGPHIIDLCHFIFGEVDRIDSVEAAKVVCSQADDRVSVNWTHRDSTQGRLEADWCDASKRKSTIEFLVSFAYAEVRVDNSAIEIKWSNDAPVTAEQRARFETPVKPFNVGFYLRGEEFSLELEEFLSICSGQRQHIDGEVPDGIAAGLKDGWEVDRVIDEIARKAGLK